MVVLHVVGTQDNGDFGLSIPINEKHLSNNFYIQTI